MPDKLLNDEGFDKLFRTARTHNAWLPKPVPTLLLQALYELLKNCPTAANSSPARFVFVTSPDAKQKLKPCLDAGNVDKTMAAPVTVIVAQDNEFYDHLPKLFPHADARSWYAGNAPLIADTAFRNSSLQGAYMMLAARSLGLDCGPMSGFDAAAVNAAFFANTPNIKANFLCNLGYGDAAKLHDRLPRLDFATACQIV